MNLPNQPLKISCLSELCHVRMADSSCFLLALNSATACKQGRIRVDRKRIYLGYFADGIEAARAYDRAARKYHGQLASLNFAD